MKSLDTQKQSKQSIHINMMICVVNVILLLEIHNLYGLV